MPQATEYVRNVPVSPFKLCTEKKKKKAKHVIQAETAQLPEPQNWNILLQQL